MLKLAKPFRDTLSSPMRALTLSLGAGALCLSGIAASGLTLANSAQAQTSVQFRQKITNNVGKCRGKGPAVWIGVSNIKAGGGTIRVQLYRGIKSDWLESGRWIYRMEVPARAGSMNFCMPVPKTGTYGIAVRHDLNSNGKTDLTSDGGGMSNNPSINIFNLGKPGYKKTAFSVGNAVKSLGIRMRYL